MQAFFSLNSQQGFIGSVKRVLAILTAFLVGAVVFFAAGIIAVTTAFVGVMMAFIAMLLRIGGRRQVAPARAKANDADVIDAHRTPRGWTVDN